MSKATELNAAIDAALKVRYGGTDSGVIFFEVPIGTGFDGQRRKADAVAMGLWPSRGMLLTGFEIKVSRSDWQRERAKPEKAEAIAAYCDHWYLVTPNAKVAHADEIPPAWGWLVLEGEGTDLANRKIPPRLRETKAPTRTEAKPLDRSFLASLLRCAGRHDAATLRAEVDKAVEVRVGMEKDRLQREYERRTTTLRANEERLAAVSEIFGDPWGDQATIAAIKAVKAAGIVGGYGGLESLHKSLHEMAERTAEAMATFGLPAEADRKAS